MRNMTYGHVIKAKGDQQTIFRQVGGSLRYGKNRKEPCVADT